MVIYVPGYANYEQMTTSAMEGYINSADAQIEYRQKEIHALEVIRDGIIKALEERKAQESA